MVLLVIYTLLIHGGGGGGWDYFGECNELGTWLNFFPDGPSIVPICTFLSRM